MFRFERNNGLARTDWLHEKVTNALAITARSVRFFFRLPVALSSNDPLAFYRFRKCLTACRASICCGGCDVVCLTHRSTKQGSTPLTSSMYCDSESLFVFRQHRCKLGTIWAIWRAVKTLCWIWSCVFCFFLDSFKSERIRQPLTMYWP